MGEHVNNGLPVSLDGRLRLACYGAKLTSDVGLLAYRALAEVAVPRALFAGILERHGGWLSRRRWPSADEG
ncbi:MAG TPA: hypothetical protein VMZ31_13955 [Phycisphaerae bacterium]|nr:hypothetical protein [Phycisphaerae bacterium]